MSTFLMILAVCLYAFIGGIVGQFTFKRAKAADSWVDGYWDNPLVAFSVAFWPLGIALLPVLLGNKVGLHLVNQEAVREKKADKAKLEHERKLELLAAETRRNESALKLIEDFHV